MPFENTSKRRLAAILFADVVGYTALMQKDEKAASAQLRKFQSAIDTQVKSHNNNDEWISTREGLVVHKSRANGISIVRNNHNQGSNSRVGTIAPDGHIFFLNRNYGWNEIDPSIVNYIGESQSKNLTLTDLYVLGEKQSATEHETIDDPLWLEDEIRLDHDAENFSLRFTDFDFQEKEFTYQYRLYPYETAWRKTPSEPMINYFKVPTGDYNFQLRSTDNNDNNVSIDINIPPPWWRTWWAYLGYILLGGLLAWLFVKSQRERAIRMERERSKDRELAQAKEIEKAYTELKSTQAQLIQSEKMASLGELTAGIAHEIQNPLNFVNNFSDVSAEMIDEAFEELDKNDIEEAKEVLTDLKGNLEKISHHGGRASSIVKGMLDHSRESSGVKELTDINALCDEYIRLSYHGLRAKDKSFNASFETNFDPSLPKIKVVSQDIGRVLLNILNNAFYAVDKKTKEESDDSEFHPKVVLKTELSPSGGGEGGGRLQITITDNGIGMSQETLEKVFQPFYTTKPTGQGTGLGMSISYDIVTKGYGGELKVESEEGEGATFLLILPN